MLVSCPECNGKVSTSAGACPHCGYDVAVSRAKQGRKLSKNGHVFPGKQNTGIWIAGSLLGALFILGGIYLWNGNSREQENKEAQHRVELEQLKKDQAELRTKEVNREYKEERIKDALERRREAKHKEELEDLIYKSSQYVTDPAACSRCGNLGYVISTLNDKPVRIKCDKCRLAIGQPCPNCMGKGKVTPPSTSTCKACGKTQKVLELERDGKLVVRGLDYWHQHANGEAFPFIVNQPSEYVCPVCSGRKSEASSDADRPPK
jgi:hypothetical protein